MIDLNEVIVNRLKRIVRKAVLFYSLRNRNRKAVEIVDWLRLHLVKDVLLVGTAGDEHAGNPEMVNAGIIE